MQEKSKDEKRTWKTDVVIRAALYENNFSSPPHLFFHSHIALSRESIPSGILFLFLFFFKLLFQMKLRNILFTEEVLPSKAAVIFCTLLP